MCLTTISWSRPHQTTNNPTGPARDNPPLATLLLYDLSLTNKLQLFYDLSRWKATLPECIDHMNVILLM